MAVAERNVQQLRADVRGNVDESDQGPGRLLRAYVRTHLSPNLPASVPFNRYLLEVHLRGIERVQEVWNEDSHWWNSQFDHDRSDPLVRDIVTAAADGIAIARTRDGELSEERARQLQDRLIALTLPDSAEGVGAAEQR